MNKIAYVGKVGQNTPLERNLQPDYNNSGYFFLCSDYRTEHFVDSKCSTAGVCDETTPYHGRLLLPSETQAENNRTLL